MTIKGVLLRFFLIYTVLIIAAGQLMNYLGVKSTTGLNIGILAGCVIWVCWAFGKKNGRYFSGKEKKVVIMGLVVIDLLLQILFSGVAILSQAPLNFNLGVFVMILGLVGVFHAIGIYFFVGMVKKPLIKQGVIDG